MHISCESKHVRVVGARLSVVRVSMSELWEQGCHSYDSQSVCLSELSKRACQS